jgi:hypothetical protein
MYAFKSRCNYTGLVGHWRSFRGREGKKSLYGRQSRGYDNRCEQQAGGCKVTLLAKDGAETVIEYNRHSTSISSYSSQIYCTRSSLIHIRNQNFRAVFAPRNVLRQQHQSVFTWTNPYAQAVPRSPLIYHLYLHADHGFGHAPERRDAINKARYKARPHCLSLNPMFRAHSPTTSQSPRPTTPAHTRPHFQNIQTHPHLENMTRYSEILTNLQGLRNGGMSTPHHTPSTPQRH